MNLTELRDGLDLAIKIINLVGVPVAIALFWWNKRSEARDREYGTFDALDDKYIEYLRLCLDNPDLDIGDLPNEKADAETRGSHRELVAFSILMSILERAYLMYRDKSHRVRRTQWLGWRQYASDWCARENFQEAWSNLRYGYDEDFLAFMDGLMAESAVEPG